MSFIETEEQRALRDAVKAMAANYGQDYYLEKARAGQHTTELWSEAGKLGFIGVNLPEEYGGGGAGMYELSLVMEEMSAAGSALLMMVVSPAINGTIISKFGTEEQKKRWIPGIADGSITMAFAITEPDAGSNSHRITTTARRDGSDWILSGQTVYISGVDQAQAVLLIAQQRKFRAKTVMSLDVDRKARHLATLYNLPGALIARALVALGVDVIEAGFPNSSRMPRRIRGSQNRVRWSLIAATAASCGCVAKKRPIWLAM